MNSSWVDVTSEFGGMFGEASVDKIENDELFFGIASAENDGSSEEKRHVDVDLFGLGRVYIEL